MVNRWHCTAIKPVFFVLTINTPQAETGILSLGEPCIELNIQTICAETSPAKGRVERAHLTLQDRLVKELRLQGICSMEAANDFAEAYMADYNRRFGKVPRHDFDVHRAVEHDEDTGLIFTVRENVKSQNR